MLIFKISMLCLITNSKHYVSLKYITVFYKYNARNFSIYKFINDSLMRKKINMQIPQPFIVINF